MGSVKSAKQLKEALTKATEVGLVEEPFTIDDCEVVLRNLRPDQYEAVVDDCKELEDLVYLDEWQKGHICRSIVQINGVDLRDTDFVEVEELDPKKNQTRTVKRELHDWIRKEILATWSKEAIFTAYRKFTDVVYLAEQKAKKGVSFIVAEETNEEKFRRLAGELKELEMEVPPALVKTILQEHGYEPYTMPQDTAAVQELEKTIAEVQAAPQEQQQSPAPAVAPSPPPAPVPAPAPEEDPARRVAQLMRTRVPITQQTVAVPEAPKAPVEVATLPVQVTPPPQAPITSAVGGRSARLAAEIGAVPGVLDDVRSEPPQAVAPPGAVPGPGAGIPTNIPMLEKQNVRTDLREMSTILERPPVAGLNPKFRPPQR